MKITPMKDYKAPKYAVGIAALVAVTASATGCVQNAGAAMTVETEPAYTDTELAGMEDTREETAAPVSNLNNTQETTCTGSDCDTTKRVETTDEPQLDGYLVVPEETTAVTGVGSIFSVAANAIKGLLGGEEPKLEGDVPMYTDDTELAGEADTMEDENTQLAGDVEVTEEEYTELAGDVAVPEEPDEYSYFESCYDTIKSVFPNGKLLSRNNCIDLKIKCGEYYNDLVGYYKFTENGKDIYIAFAQSATRYTDMMFEADYAVRFNNGWFTRSEDGKNVLVITMNAYDVPVSQKNVESLKNEFLAEGII